MADRKIAVQYRPLSTLHPHPRNARQHPERSLSAIEKSIAKFGFVNPILALKDGTIIAGEGRWRAATRAGLDRVPVVVLDMTEQEALALLVVDNATQTLSTWSESLLGDIARELKGTDFDLRDLGEFDFLPDVDFGDGPGKGGGEDPGPQLDNAAELQTKWGVQPGDLWICGEHRVLCGDCTDAATVARVMGEERYALLVTDPPYGVSYADKNAFLNAVAPAHRIQERIEGDHQTPEQMAAFWTAAFTAVRVAAAPGASYYVTGPQCGDLLLLLLLSLRTSGFPLRHMLVWAKNNHVLGRCDYNYKHEPILFGWVEGAHRFYGPSNEVSLWAVDKPHKSDLHPTTKPVELFARAVTNSSAPGDLVCDPFLGSGTTLIACQQLGRRARGIELEPKYVAVSLERWSLATGRVPTRA